MIQLFYCFIGCERQSGCDYGREEPKGKHGLGHEWIRSPPRQGERRWGASFCNRMNIVFEDTFIVVLCCSLCVVFYDWLARTWLLGTYVSMRIVRYEWRTASLSSCASWTYLRLSTLHSSLRFDPSSSLQSCPFPPSLYTIIPHHVRPFFTSSSPLSSIPFPSYVPSFFFTSHTPFPPCSFFFFIHFTRPSS